MSSWGKAGQYGKRADRVAPWLALLWALAIFGVYHGNNWEYYRDKVTRFMSLLADISN